LIVVVWASPVIVLVLLVAGKRLDDNPAALSLKPVSGENQ
jgi:hypothetical protein